VLGTGNTFEDILNCNQPVNFSEACKYYCVFVFVFFCDMT
jgi:hypothetical protein